MSPEQLRTYLALAGSVQGVPDLEQDMSAGYKDWSSGEVQDVFNHSVVSNSAVSWTIAHQAPLSMGFF